MDNTIRYLLIGLVGIAILLVSVLVYSQVTASHNYDLPAFGQDIRPR